MLLAVAAAGMLLLAASWHSCRSQQRRRYCYTSPVPQSSKSFEALQLQQQQQRDADSDKASKQHAAARCSNRLQASVLGRMLGRFQAALDVAAAVAAELGAAGLLLLSAAASLLYCITDVAAAVTSALQCTELDPSGEMLPGEVRSAMGKWWSQDLRTPCFSGVHLGVVVVAGAVGLPLVLCTVVLVVLATRAVSKEEYLPAGRLQWRRLQQLRVSNNPACMHATGGARCSAFLDRSRAAVDLLGWVLTMPFYECTWWWSAACVVWRILLAAAVAALGGSAGSASVMLAGLAASAWLSCLQLLHAVLLPAARPERANAAIAGSYMALQVMCLLLAVGGMQSMPAAAAAGLLTVAAVGDSCMCLYLVFAALRTVLIQP